MSKRFLRTYIELSDLCGLKCSFCPAPKGRRGEMGLELFERVCLEIAPLTQSVSFHLLGDPLMLESFPQYLQIAHKHSLRVEIVTSGVYLHRYSPSLLLSPPIAQINISLSALRDLSEGVRERVVRECLELISFHQKSKKESFINLRMHENAIDQALLQRFLDEFENIQREEDRIRLGYKIFIVFTKSFEWVRAQERGETKVVKKTCYGLLKQIGILANGKVVPCCIDCDGGIELGDIQTQSLEEILNSKRAQAIREGFLRGIAIEEQCQRCSYAIRS